MRKKKNEFPRWPSELPANLCRPICPHGQTGWHSLAGNSEGHRGNSIFLLFLVGFPILEAYKMSFLRPYFPSIRKNFQTQWSGLV